MEQRGFRTASRRYNRLFWPLMGVYVVLVLGFAFMVDKQEAALWLKTVAALAVSAPLLAVLWVILRRAFETDEYTRMRQMRGLAIAGLVTAGACFVIGFLQLWEVIGYFDVFWLGPVYLIVYGLASGRDCFGKTV